MTYINVLFLIECFSDLQTVMREMTEGGQKFTSLAYATEKIETAKRPRIIETQLIDDPHDDIPLNQVVIALPDNRLLMVFLDNETYVDFEDWAELEAVVICECDDSRLDRHTSRKETQQTSVSTVEQETEMIPMTVDNSGIATGMTSVEHETVMRLSTADNSATTSAAPDPTVEQTLHTDETVTPTAPDSEQVTLATREVSCQTDFTMTTNTDETSSDDPQIAIKKQYRRLPLKVRDARAG